MDEDRILDGWLAAIARDGWRDATPAAAAELGGVAPGEVAAVLPDRWGALAAFGRRLDRAALSEAEADAGASVRDRLFGLLMARFDAAEPHKATLRTIAEAARRDPALAAFALAGLGWSMGRIAAAAGVETGGLLGLVRVEALTALALHVSRTWLDDADAELAATMKALDTDLERAERWAKRAAPSR